MFDSPRSLFNLLLAASLFLLAIGPADAVRVVRFELEYGGEGDGEAAGGLAFGRVNRTLDLELYDADTPLTVANFLDYVNGGFYDLVFINRSDPFGVIQAGRFNYITADPENDPFDPFIVGEVPIQSGNLPLLNEPGLSNVRGTIAMAKVANQPDSARNEWYINFNDNVFLDTTNGGFTVFGAVVDDGMSVVDEIAAFPTSAFFTNILPQYGSALGQWPFADLNFFDGQVPYQRNLIMILTAREITRPVMRFTPAEGDIGFDDPTNTLGTPLDVTLVNTGNEALDIDSIDTTALAAPFTLLSNDCTGATLQPVETTPASACTLRVEFDAVSAGQFEQAITVGYSSQAGAGTFSVTYPLAGKGAFAGVAAINAAAAVDVGTAQVAGNPAKILVRIRNFGELPLTVANIDGLTGTGFSQSNDCIGAGVQIGFAESCFILVEYAATAIGDSNATMTVLSDDPVNGSIAISLSASGDKDSDGVPSTTEAAAPNQGDANFDGIQDDLQNEVASIDIGGGRFITLVSDDAEDASQANLLAATTLSRVVHIDTPVAGAPIPAFDYGNFGFDVVLTDNGITGDTVVVGMFLPAGVNPTEYYRYGPTPDDPEPHWYDFGYLEANGTGVQTFGRVRLGDVERTLLVITLTDGALGDDDLEENGFIAHGAGGPGLAPAGDSGGAAWLWLLSIPLVAARRRFASV